MILPSCLPMSIPYWSFSSECGLRRWPRFASVMAFKIQRGFLVRVIVAASPPYRRHATSALALSRVVFSASVVSSSREVSAWPASGLVQNFVEGRFVGVLEECREFFPVHVPEQRRVVHAI